MTNEGMDEWMDRPATFLSNFFYEQPLIWATSALSCLPASSFVASATQFFSLRSCYNAFDGLQMQPRTRVALWSRTTVRAAFTMRLATCSRNPVCQELRTCFAPRTAPMRFANTCHTKSSNVRSALTMGTIPRCSENGVVSRCLYAKPSSRHSLMHILLSSSSKSAPNASVLFWKFEAWIELSLVLHVHHLSTAFPDRAANPRKQRPYFSDPRSHTTQKT